MNEIIYLDNAATTKPSEAALSAMMKSAEIFGNPSSLHGLGLAAEKLMRDARKIIGGMLGTDEKTVFFTSGGTEANNTAVFGAAQARKKLGTKLITTKIEHPSVLEAFRQMEKQGFNVVYLDVLPDGRIDLDELRKTADKETTLVSIMYVNNETGVIQPVAEVKEILRKQSPNAVFHSDCVQAFGKIDVKMNKIGADMITVSSHKIHGLKGTGALCINDIRKIRPLLYGGEQQNEIRPGTENVGGILAFAAAAEECGIDNSRLIGLRNLMKSQLMNIPDIKINGSDEYNSGSILNVSFTGIKAEILLHALEARGVYVSTGSACSSHKPQPSHVLTAMGLSKKEVEGAVRFSFDTLTTDSEVIEAAEITEAEVKAIRRFM